MEGFEKKGVRIDQVKMAKRKSKISVEYLMENHNPEIRAVVEALRGLIKEEVPEASERANGGWHSINYRHPTQGYFCGIFPRTEKVILVFEYGILLPDPDGILEGEGSQVREYVVRDPSKIHAESLRKLIEETLSLPTSKAEKMEMIRSGVRLI